MHAKAYIQQLRRDTEARHAEQAQRAAAGLVAVDPRAALKTRIVQWLNVAGPDMRAARLHMEALAQIFKAPPHVLGLALRELGWTCRRIWRKGEAYRHYWSPPPGDAS